MDYLRIQAVACAAVLGAFLNDPAAAQSASDVVCNGCVGSSDIADGSIKTDDLSTNAIKTANLSRSAVTFAKLSPGIQDRLDKAIAEINFTVTGTQALGATEAICDADKFPVSATCGCHNNQGANNYGVLWYCGTDGNGAIAGCLHDALTYDPQLPGPVAVAQATCMGATSADGTPWVPTPTAFVPNDRVNESDAEWLKEQDRVREDALAELRKQIAEHTSRIRN